MPGSGFEDLVYQGNHSDWAIIPHIEMTASRHQQDKSPGAVEKHVLRRHDGRVIETRDLVAAEVPVAFAYNGTPFAVMMATPGDLEDFAFGFSLSEGIVAQAHELQIEAIETSLEGVSIALAIPPQRAAALERRNRNLQGRSGCGRERSALRSMATILVVDD